MVSVFIQFYSTNNLLTQFVIYTVSVLDLNILELYQQQTLRTTFKQLWPLYCTCSTVNDDIRNLLKIISIKFPFNSPYNYRKMTHIRQMYALLCKYSTERNWVQISGNRTSLPSGQQMGQTKIGKKEKSKILLCQLDMYSWHNINNIIMPTRHILDYKDMHIFLISNSTLQDSVMNKCTYF